MSWMRCILYLIMIGAGRLWQFLGPLLPTTPTSGIGAYPYPSYLDRGQDANIALEGL
jgi:hypothetical protein